LPLAKALKGLPEGAFVFCFSEVPDQTIVESVSENYRSFFGQSGDMPKIGR
jgi:hypothetical protein